MSHRTYNFLFLCTGNSARSILAESILRKEGAGRFMELSAGSQPKGKVSVQKPETSLPSGAPQMDFVFAVCGDAAGEACPVWPGQPMTAHRCIEDPSNVEAPTSRKSAPSPPPPAL